MCSTQASTHAEALIIVLAPPTSTSERPSMLIGTLNAIYASRLPGSHVLFAESANTPETGILLLPYMPA